MASINRACFAGMMFDNFADSVRVPSGGALSVSALLWGWGPREAIPTLSITPSSYGVSVNCKGHTDNNHTGVYFL